MMKDIWIDAVGMIDEEILGDFIEKDLAITGGIGVLRKREKTSRAWIGYVAACFCILALTVFAIYSGVMRGIGDPSDGSGIDPLGPGSTPSESESTEPLPDDEHLGDYTYSDYYTLSLNFELDAEGQYYTVTSCDYAPDEIVIPRIYMGRYVTAIADKAFKNHRNLVKVTIPDSIHTVGNSAFENCESLENITLSKRTQFLGDSSFASCTKLKGIAIPASLAAIGKKAFYGCESLESVSFSEGLVEIGDSAFEKCAKITRVDLPAGFESLGSKAFYGCPNIESVTVADSVKYCGDMAFDDSKNRVCHTEEGVYYLGNPNNKYLVAVHMRSQTLKNVVIRDGCKVIAEKSFCGYDNIESVYIPESVEYIGSSAFENNTKLAAVVIGGESCLVEIGDYAFYKCYALSAINLQAGVVRIGKSAFSRCTSLDLRTLPDSVEYIGDEVFGYCESITEFALPKKLAAIPNDAFINCFNLESITVSDGVRSIGDRAFLQTKISEMVIGGNVETVGDEAFSMCNNLKKLVFSEGVKVLGKNVIWGSESIETVSFPNSLESLEEQSISSSKMKLKIYNDAAYLGNESNPYMILFTVVADAEELVVAPECKFIMSRALASKGTLRGVVLPEGLIGIGKGAFYGCQNLRSVNLPSTLKYLGQDVFFGCCIESEIVIPKGIEVIEAQTFSDCVMETMTIPDTVKVINSIPSVSIINYEGTVAQWNALMEASSIMSPGECIVKCSDGNIDYTIDLTQ